MSYMLDTNTCIYIMRQSSQNILERFRKESGTDIAISSITIAELTFGMEKSKKVKENLAALEKFLEPFQRADFDGKAASVYGRVRFELERKGTPIGPLDTLIAAHALSLGSTLVTNNLKEFKRVPKLRLENWL
jgi:tRNA(fMet)-specific endonuclease VapC